MSIRLPLRPARRIGRGARGLSRRWAALAGGILAGAAAAGSGGSPALRLQVACREAVPGEPLRVLVDSPERLSSVEGSFGDRPLFFLRLGDPAGAGERWAAWTAIELGAKPGTRRIEVRGTGPRGSGLRASTTVRIAFKRFPEQRLEVEREYVEPPKEVLARIESEQARLARIYARRTAPALASAPFAKPVPGEPTSEFGLRRLFNGQPRSPHPGIDLRAGNGTPVLASADGEVALADDLYFSGKTVILDHGGGLFTIYGHLSRIDVREGELARLGKPLGLSGATGRVTGPHLHWGARAGGTVFDPRALLDPMLFAER